MESRKRTYFRHPRTTYERRWAIEGWCRPRRNVKNLVCSYSDICVGRGSWSKSWKDRTKRRKQYKPKDLP